MELKAFALVLFLLAAVSGRISRTPNGVLKVNGKTIELKGEQSQMLLNSDELKVELADIRDGLNNHTMEDLDLSSKGLKVGFSNAGNGTYDHSSFELTARGLDIVHSGDQVQLNVYTVNSSSVLFLGSRADKGSGLAFNDNRADSLSFYRRDGGSDVEVFYFSANSDTVYFNGGLVVSGPVQFSSDITVTQADILIVGPDPHISKLEVRGTSQGTGYIYVGQSTTHGGGIVYNGDDTPDLPHSVDSVSIFRRSNSVDVEVIRIAHNSNQVYFYGGLTVSGGSSSFADAVTFNSGLTVNNAVLSATNGITVSGAALTVNAGLTVNTNTLVVNSAFVLQRADADVARLEVRGSAGQGTGTVYVGQSTSHGGGMTYNGDNTPDMPTFTADYISFFRRQANVETAVFAYPYSNNNVYFYGSVYVGGTLVHSSDRRLKKDIKTIDNALEKITKLRGVSYLRDDLDEAHQHQLGVIAQEVQEVLPEIVRVANQDNGYLGVTYIELIPVLIEAMKEQQNVFNEAMKEQQNVFNEAMKEQRNRILQLESLVEALHKHN